MVLLGGLYGYLGAYGEIQHLPEAGGVQDQPWDLWRLLKEFAGAVAQGQKVKSERERNKPKPKGRGRRRG